MSKAKKPSRLARAIAKFLTHKHALGCRYRQEAHLLASLLRQVEENGRAEVTRLTIGDVEEHGTVLRIRESKFHKSRLVPLSVSTARELQAYLVKRRKTFAVHPSTPLLGHRLDGGFHPYGLRGLWGAINALFKAAGVHGEGGQRPRVHDLRHSFAVQALLRWYRAGADIQAQLPKLALYMGHVSIASSAHYLHWVPSLQRLASDRFEQRFGHLVQGGAR